MLGMSGGFPSAALRGCLLTTGRWYWEFKLESEGCVRAEGA